MRGRLSTFNFRSRDPLAGILLFAVLVVVIEGTLALALPDNFLVRQFRWMMARATGGEAPSLQIMGDSAAHHGLVPAAFEPAAGGPGSVRQDALAGSGPEFAYFFLKRQLAAGHVPGSILYGPSPHTFDSSRVPLYVGACADAGEIAEIATSGTPVDELAYALLCRASFTLRYREQIRQWLTGDTSVVGNFTALVDTASDLRHASDAGPQSFPEDRLPAIYRKPFAVTPSNRHFLEGFLALCQQEHIPVYWTSMPVLPVVAKSRDQFGFLPAYGDFIEDLKSRYGIIVLQKDYPVYRDEEFFDYTHLTQKGANRFSTGLATKLEAAVKSPTLPDP